MAEQKGERTVSMMAWSQCHLWVTHLWTASVGNNPHLFKALMYSFLLRTVKGILNWYPVTLQ